MIGYKNQVVHFVNGRQLCEQQYSNYRYSQGFNDCREKIVFELASLVDLRNKPETLCAKFLDWLEPQLQSLKRQ